MISAVFVLGNLSCDKSTESKTDPLILQLEPIHVSFFSGSDGSIDLTVSGGIIPYQYQWSNGETSEDLTNLVAGTYSVTVTDANAETITDSTSITQPNDTTTVIDIDGNVYQTIKIGNQFWMAENLKTTRAADGSVLNGVYAYDDDENNVAEYGRLYTWQAAFDAEIPGWHLPSDEDWNVLEAEVGSEPGTKLKEGGISGFDAKMAGYRNDSGGYAHLGSWTMFWSSTPYINNHVIVRNLFSDQTSIVRSGCDMMGGNSVRYLRD